MSRYCYLSDKCYPTCCAQRGNRDINGDWILQRIRNTMTVNRKLDPTTAMNISLHREATIDVSSDFSLRAMINTSPFGSPGTV